MTKSKSILALITLLVSMLSLHAQVEVRLIMNKPQYVIHEPITATLQLSNRTGRDITLQSTPDQSWLTFNVTSHSRRDLIAGRKVMFQAVNIPAGKTVKRNVNISQSYLIQQYGNYHATAMVRAQGIGVESYISNRVPFTVTNAPQIFSQVVGIPGQRNSSIEYQVLRFNTGRQANKDSHEELYISIKDVKTGQNRVTYSLGGAQLFRNPDIKLDGDNNLHLLYLISPSTYKHLTINTNGQIIDQSFTKRGAVGDPYLETLEGGAVLTRGGVAYDPKAEAEKRNAIKKASDRPDIIYNN
ncbi:hypothetical protein [Persicirhabdus sediminis]|uniref:Molecular chaperone n=1 Tax=Persicirhabdus sediminis TaxID=454144 RepID=A0A8J7SI36_9BACT|nr:hypothetical protein [Persicirhabdus sediminis]MBK1790274.1 hypothetical protein [Persicirhabdus sediminis]